MWRVGEPINFVCQRVTLVEGCESSSMNGFVGNHDTITVATKTAKRQGRPSKESTAIFGMHIQITGPSDVK